MSLEEIVQRAKVGCSDGQLLLDRDELLHLLEISAFVYERDIVDLARLALLERIAATATVLRSYSQAQHTYFHGALQDLDAAVDALDAHDAEAPACRALISAVVGILVRVAASLD